jgi:hypothetical protein
MLASEQFGADVLFVPARPRNPASQVELELRTLPDGRLALPVYTSLGSLVRCCGQHQPWGAVDAAGFTTLKDTLGFDIALVDARIPPEYQHRAPEIGTADVDDDEAIGRSWLQDGRRSDR